MGEVIEFRPKAVQQQAIPADEHYDDVSLKDIVAAFADVLADFSWNLSFKQGQYRDDMTTDRKIDRVLTRIAWLGDRIIELMKHAERERL